MVWYDNTWFGTYNAWFGMVKHGFVLLYNVRQGIVRFSLFIYSVYHSPQGTSNIIRNSLTVHSIKLFLTSLQHPPLKRFNAKTRKITRNRTFAGFH